MNVIAVLVVPKVIALSTKRTCRLRGPQEGYKDGVYGDTTGHKTICYGFNLDATGAEGKITQVCGGLGASRTPSGLSDCPRSMESGRGAF